MDVGDAKLYYLDSGGEGETVVLMHAMTGSARVWERQWDVLVKAGYRVIAYSRRGHWGSSPIDPDAPGAGAEDLKALLDGLGVKKFHGVGTAGGAHYLVDFAVKWHPMLRSMTCACGTMAINEPDHLAILRGVIPEQGLLGFPSTFVELSPAYRAADPEGTARWAALEHIARFDNSLMQPKLHGVTWEELGRITAPVMVLGGGADLFITPTLLENAVQHYRDYELHIIDNVGHSAHWEDPRTFNTLLLNFLARHGVQA